jgi:hypothetical protein
VKLKPSDGEEDELDIGDEQHGRLANAWPIRAA